MKASFIQPSYKRRLSIDFQHEYAMSVELENSKVMFNKFEFCISNLNNVFRAIDLFSFLEKINCSVLIVVEKSNKLIRHHYSFERNIKERIEGRRIFNYKLNSY